MRYWVLSLYILLNIPYSSSLWGREVTALRFYLKYKVLENYQYIFGTVEIRGSLILDDNPIFLDQVKNKHRNKTYIGKGRFTRRTRTM